MRFFTQGHSRSQQSASMDAASPTRLAAAISQRRPVASVQRACLCGEGCPRCQAQHIESSDSARTGVPPDVHLALSSPEQYLDQAARAKMETRFGHDFSRVRVHTDARSAQSVRTVNSSAYTVGNHIVFGADRYNPATREGSRLLAHELTHVVQQGPIDTIPSNLRLGDANAAAELEADRVAAQVAAGANVGVVQRRQPPAIARFSDTGHHVVEEAALAGAGFSETQRKGIEKGNVERDYSQVGVVGNAILLCRPQKFGGYKPEEHFDNYMWDAVTQGWRTRGASALGDQGVDIGRTPIDFIGGQLDEVASRGLTNAGLTRLGNAFHTVEDFFAHSNFVELVQGDTRHGSTLMTGNPGGDEPIDSENPGRDHAGGRARTVSGAVRSRHRRSGTRNSHGNGARRSDHAELHNCEALGGARGSGFGQRGSVRDGRAQAGTIALDARARRRESDSLSSSAESERQVVGNAHQRRCRPYRPSAR